MADTNLRDRPATRDTRPTPAPAPAEAAPPPHRLRAVPFLVTAIGVLLAGLAFWAMWEAYVAAPWTRDGRVRAYVVTITPEVSGRIVQLPVADNQLVHKGDLLIAIDPSDYAIAVENADAAAARAKSNADNAEREAQRREQLTDLSTSVEEKQTFTSNAIAATAQQRQAVAELAQARVNLDRATIRSPVDGYITNLQTQLGDYASAGRSAISVVDANSYWIDGYFEETALADIRPGDHAKVRLMGYKTLISGHVGSVARGITVSNATPGQSGLADVNPIFTWVRLAQRVPVRIEIDAVPDGVTLVAGQTASVEIEPSGPSR